MAAFSMDRVVTILRERHDLDAYVEMTGGMVATIYAGPTWEDPTYGTRSAVVAGPGLYGQPGQESMADTAEFWIGMDDDSVTEWLDLGDYLADEADAEALASTAARLTAETMLCNLLAVARLHQVAGGSHVDAAVLTATAGLTPAALARVDRMVQDTRGYAFGDALSAYQAWDGWNFTTRQSRPGATAAGPPSEDRS